LCSCLIDDISEIVDLVCFRLEMFHDWELEAENGEGDIAR
jgi:hypothetical protein